MWQYCPGSVEKNPTTRRTGSRCWCPRRRDWFRRWPSKGNGSGSCRHWWQRRGAVQRWVPRRRAVGSGGRAAFPQAFLNGCGRGACGARSTWSPGRPPWSTATSCRPYAGTGLAPDPASCRSTIHTQLHKHEEVIRCHYPCKHHLCVSKVRVLEQSSFHMDWYTVYDTGHYRCWRKVKLPIPSNGQKWRAGEQLPQHLLACSLETTPFIYRSSRQRTKKWQK
jgi:hypothetical protein